MIKKFVALAVVMLAALTASATMTSSYSTYDSYTVVNGTSVTVMVLLEGNTNWNGMPPAQHTAHVSLTFGGTNHASYEGPYSPSFNMNLNAQVTLAQSDSCFTGSSGCPISVDEGYVDCSVAGLFYFTNGSGSGNNINPARTRMQILGSNQGSCSQTFSYCGYGPGCGYGFKYTGSTDLAPYCDSASYDPDWQPTALVDCRTNGSGGEPTGLWAIDTITMCEYTNLGKVVSCSYDSTKPYNGTASNSEVTGAIQTGACTQGEITQ